MAAVLVSLALLGSPALAATRGPARSSGATAVTSAVVAPTTSAAAPTTSAPAPSASTSSTPGSVNHSQKPAAIKPWAAIGLTKGFWYVSGLWVTLPRWWTEVRILEAPFVRGQWVKLEIRENGRLIKTAQMPLERTSDGRYGQYYYGFSIPDHGDVTVTVRHQANSRMRGFVTQQWFPALDENVGFGSTGRFVSLVQYALSGLHFYVPLTGVYDQGTGLAIDAYHRLLGWGTYQTLDQATISLLMSNWGSFPVQYANHGAHAEGNLTKQLLALIIGSRVQWIFPISSGKSTTPTVTGNFYVYNKVPGYLPDGMYYSSFFYGGYAIHGYDPAPDWPASHGCMRLPIVDAVFVYDWLQNGYPVDVYGTPHYWY